MIKTKKNLFKKNAIANYFGQAYTLLVSIIIYPFYLKYLGPEAYGLIGLFVVIQAWLGLLELGMAPTLERQVAYTRGSNGDFVSLKKMLRSIETILMVFSIIVVFLTYISRFWVAANWLTVEDLSLEVVAISIVYMVLINSFRWLTFVYKSGISGMEDQIWLNTSNVAFSTVKFIGVLIVFVLVDATPLVFFKYQLLVGILEFIVLRYKLYSYFKNLAIKGIVIFSFSSIKEILPFALGLAYSSSLWIFITQFDKLLLSNILTLKNYGYFTLVAIIAAGLMQLSAPIGKAVLPRMTNLLANGQEAQMLQMYRKASQVVAIIVVSVATVIAFFGEELIYVWTGDIEAAKWAAPILFWYVLGNALLPLVMFQYYLQYAHGELKLHVIMNTIMAVITLPTIYLVAINYGAYGTAIAWFILQICLFLIWPPIVHRKFAKKIHKDWLFKDILPILVGTISLVMLVRFLSKGVYSFESRIEGLVFLGLVGLLILLFSALSSNAVREIIKRKLHR